MANSEQRGYKYPTEEIWVGVKCVELIIDRILKAREGREKNHLEIYFSLNDILGLNGRSHFLQEYAAREMHDCQVENRPFRNTQQLLSCEDYDDSIEDYLSHMGILQNYGYVGENDKLKLKSADLKKNTKTDLDVTGAKDFSILSEVLPSYIFITSSNLALRVGWWYVHLPDNFIYQLLKYNLIDKKGYTKISDNIYVNISEGILVGEKRDRIVKKMDGKRKTRQYGIIENLMLYRSSGSKYAAAFLHNLPKSETDEIIKLFAEVSDDDVVTRRGTDLRFVQNL